jgi:hypothetical protein
MKDIITTEVSGVSTGCTLETLDGATNVGTITVCGGSFGQYWYDLLVVDNDC